MAKIWFLLPAFNEGKNIGVLINSIDYTMKYHQHSYSIVLIDDGSIDNTFYIAKEMAKSKPIEIIKHIYNMNLGRTVRDGLEFIIKNMENNDIIITMDADNTHPLNISENMIEYILSGKDIVIASRYKEGAAEIGLIYYRRFLSKIVNKMLKTIFPIHNIMDYTCGYRAYNGKLLLKGYHYYKGEIVEEKGFTCMAEILIKLRPFIQSAEEVPLILRYDLKGGASKMKIIFTILGYFKLITKEFIRGAWLGDVAGKS